MFVLAVGLLARASIGPSERLLIMVGQQHACAAAYAVAAFAINLVACLLLVPYFGGVGAAMSTSLALVVESLLLFYVVRQRLGLYSFIARAARENHTVKFRQHRAAAGRRRV